mgnify:CR=1 FL=1|jgi:hypothetical protein
MGATAPARPSARARWYRQPMVWLAITLFALIVAACVTMIVLGARHADEPLAGVGERILKVPVSRSPTQQGR